MLVFGIAFVVVVCGLAQFLLNPPAGIYSVYVSDVPQTTTGSTQFTVGYAS